VLPADLHLEGDRLMHGAHPVDAVYRRCDADTLDTPEGRLLGPPQVAGTLGVVNAYGCGVGDDKLAHAYVEDMVRFYLGEEPTLRSVPSYDLACPDQLERALDEFDRLVIKPRAGQGGNGVVVCPHAERTEIEAARKQVRDSPQQWVAQRYVELSQHPTLVDGALAGRHVDLRPFVFMQGADDAQVLTGGLTRVALEEGDVIVNTSQNGGFKDTWVLDR
jgi:carboxylate-amine ligase